MSSSILSIIQMADLTLFQLQSELAAGHANEYLYATQPRNAPVEQSIQSRFEQQAMLAHQIAAQRNGTVDNESDATANKAADADPLLTIGRLLFNDLIPPSIQQALRRLPNDAQLVIVSNDGALPWELAHDGQTFLSLRVKVTRQGLADLPSQHSDNQSTSSLSILLIGNPTGDLTETAQEIQEITTLLDRQPTPIQRRVLLSRRASKDRVIQAIASGQHTIIHYSGHARFGKPNAAAGGLVLAGEEILTFDEIARHLRGTPLLFLNGCESAKAGVQDGADSSVNLGDEQQVLRSTDSPQAMATSLLQKGAVGVIGSFWPVLDEQARLFATGFYQQILRGQSISDAVHSVRRRTQQRTSTSPHWAAYTLYGNPGYRPYIMQRTERRLITVLAGRVAGLQEQFRPDALEAASAAEESFHASVQSVAQRYGGTLSIVDTCRFTIRFGLPTLHEDNADRSVRAGLDILALSSQEIPSSQEGADKLRIQVGISTGYVITRTGSSNDADRSEQPISVSGNVAASAMDLSVASPAGEVWLDGGTQQRLRVVFPLERIAKSEAKQPIYRLDAHPHAAAFASQADRHDRSRPFVGRQQEMTALQNFWQQTQIGRGCVVDLVGPAGMGKSHLLESFVSQVGPSDQREHLTIHCRCLTYDQHRQYALLEQIVCGLAHITVSDDPQTRQSKLETLVRDTITGLGASLEQYLDETLALVSPVLGLDYSVPTIDSLEPQLRFGRLASVAQSFVAYLSQQQPLLLVVDDLQWIDENSRDILGEILSVSQELPVMVLLSHRPDWSHPWASLGHYHHLPLRELTQDANERLLVELLSAATLPPDLLVTLSQRLGSTPLFLTAFVEALREDGTLQIEENQWTLTTDLDTLTIPESIETLVQARMDQLPASGRELLQRAAVIGPKFEQRILQELEAEANQGHPSQSQVTQHLQELTRREFIRSSVAFASFSATYVFSHDLIHRSIYNNIIDPVRRLLHRLVAQVLSQLQREDAFDQLARHYHLANDRVNAIRFSLQAADQAASQWANESALSLYGQALNHLRTFDTEALTDAEITDDLTDKTLLSWKLAALEGMATVLTAVGQNEAAIERLTEALAITAEGGIEAEIQAELLRKKAVAHHDLGEFEEAWEALAQALNVLGDPNLPSAGRIHAWRGIIQYRRGELQEALETAQLAEQVLAGDERFEGQRDRAQVLNLQSVIYRVQGNTDAAENAAIQSIRIYDQIAYLPGQSRAYSNLSCVYQDLGRWDDALANTEQSCHIDKRTGEQWRQVATAIDVGEIYRRQGKLDEALSAYMDAEKLSEQLQLLEALGLVKMNSGAVYLKKEELHAAENHLNQSQLFFEQANVLVHQPELLRYQAELKLARNQLAEALQQGTQALTKAKELNRELEIGLANRVLGQIYLAQNSLADAEDYLSRSYELLRQQSASYEVGLTLMALARLEEQKARQHGTSPSQTKAKNYIEEAITVFRQLNASLEIEQATEVQQRIRQ